VRSSKRDFRAYYLVMDQQNFGKAAVDNKVLNYYNTGLFNVDSFEK